MNMRVPPVLKSGNGPIVAAFLNTSCDSVLIVAAY